MRRLMLINDWDGLGTADRCAVMYQAFPELRYGTGVLPEHRRIRRASWKELSHAEKLKIASVDWEWAIDQAIERQQKAISVL